MVEQNTFLASTHVIARGLRLTLLHTNHNCLNGSTFFLPELPQRVGSITRKLVNIYQETIVGISPYWVKTKEIDGVILLYEAFTQMKLK
jgi:hypothetical protein